MIVYHYTNKASINSIIRSGRLRPSNPWTSADAAYGTGWYFTDLSPDTCDMDVAYYCWRNTYSTRSRVKYYVAYNIPSSLLRTYRKHVYMLSRWDSRIRRVRYGEKPDCGLKPCRNCPDGQKYGM